MKIIDILKPQAIIPELNATEKVNVLSELADTISKNYPTLDKEDVMHALVEREKLGSTGIENGIAIPHAKLKALNEIAMAFGKSTNGVSFEAHDGKPSHIFFVLLAPTNSTSEHLNILARISKLAANKEFIAKLMNTKDKGTIYRVITEEDNKLEC